MNNAPEKIWAQTSFDYYGWGRYGDWYGDGVKGGTEYTRTDIANSKRKLMTYFIFVSFGIGLALGSMFVVLVGL